VSPLQTRTKRTLRVDAAAERALDDLIAELHAARSARKRSQEAVAARLPVRGRAISEWETRAVTPKLRYLILWSDALNCSLAIVGPDGYERKGSARQRPGEAWEAFERRRLASPMRERRRTANLSQDAAGELVGVSGSSVQRWELAIAIPRPIALIVWARTFGFNLVLREQSARTPREVSAPTGNHLDYRRLKTGTDQGEQ